MELAVSRREGWSAKPRLWQITAPGRSKRALMGQCNRNQLVRAARPPLRWLLTKGCRGAGSAVVEDRAHNVRGDGHQADDCGRVGWGNWGAAWAAHGVDADGPEQPGQERDLAVVGASMRAKSIGLDRIIFRSPDV